MDFRDTKAKMALDDLAIVEEDEEEGRGFGRGSSELSDCLFHTLRGGPGLFSL